MSKRNVAWLIVVIGVFVLVGIAVGWLIGAIAGVATLVVSEWYERDRRRRRRAARGEGAVTPVRDSLTRRRR